MKKILELEGSWEALAYLADNPWILRGSNAATLGVLTNSLNCDSIDRVAISPHIPPPPHSHALEFVTTQGPFDPLEYQMKMAYLHEPRRLLDV